MEENATIIKLLDAAIFAAKEHKGQVRKGSSRLPYITHPLAVAREILQVGGIDDPDILVAAILHDTIEDSKTPQDVIRERFGDRVLSLVLEVSDDKSLEKSERKRLQVVHAPHLSNDAIAIKMADKIVNSRDILEDPPEDWSLKRLQEYIQWSADVIYRVRGTNAHLEAVFDGILASAERELNFKIQPFNTIDQRPWAP